MPKVSIVLLNYNYARYLDERIQSLLNQTYKDFELIILDNGSTDNSLEIINKYTEEPRIKTHFYSENDSPYKRLNEGFDFAQGEYLLIACSDDSCHPTLIEKLAEKLDKYSSVGLAFAQSWDIDSEGKKLRLWKEWTDDLNEERWSKDFVDAGKNECQYLFFRCTIPCASAVLMRRKTFIEAGKFDAQLRLAADWMLWVKMLMISDIAFVAEPLSYFRTHANATRNTTKSAIELEERLQVVCYLSQKAETPENFWETVYIPTLGWWIRMLLNGKIPFGRSQRIYRLLREIDPNINQRIVENMFNVFRRKLKLI